MFKIGKAIFTASTLLLSAAGVLAGSVGTANAALAPQGGVNPDFGYSWLDEHCQTDTTNGVTVKGCLEVGWKKQADGSGVLVTDLWMSFPNGCPEGLPDTYKWNGVGYTYNIATGAHVNDTAGFLGSACYEHRDLNVAGPEVGKTGFKFNTTWWLTDRNANHNYDFQLCPDGTKDAACTG